jgi:hypothetical protein
MDKRAVRANSLSRASRLIRWRCWWALPIWSSLVYAEEGEQKSDQAYGDENKQKNKSQRPDRSMTLAGLFPRCPFLDQFELQKTGQFLRLGFV